jgi:hypothetical protein
MTHRLRHCAECPGCGTRYLVGFSPYRNGSYLLPLAAGSPDEWLLRCSCDAPPVCSRWRWNELKTYEVSRQAHLRGYGSAQEIVMFGWAVRQSL